MHLPTSQLSSLAVQDSSSWGDDDGGGWDDPDVDDVDDGPNGMLGGGSARSAKGSMPLGGPRGGVATTTTSLFAAPANEDDLFGAIGLSKGKPASAAVGVAARHRGAKLAVPVPAATAKPSVTKLIVDDDPVGDGWDDF
jgi:hypothetical protein